MSVISLNLFPDHILMDFIQKVHVVLLCRLRRAASWLNNMVEKNRSQVFCRGQNSAVEISVSQDFFNIRCFGNQALDTEGIELTPQQCYERTSGIFLGAIEISRVDDVNGYSKSPISEFVPFLRKWLPRCDRLCLREIENDDLPCIINLIRAIQLLPLEFEFLNFCQFFSHPNVQLASTVVFTYQMPTIFYDLPENGMFPFLKNKERLSLTIDIEEQPAMKKHFTRLVEDFCNFWNQVSPSSTFMFRMESAQEFIGHFSRPTIMFSLDFPLLEPPDTDIRFTVRLVKLNNPLKMVIVIESFAISVSYGNILSFSREILLKVIDNTFDGFNNAWKTLLRESSLFLRNIKKCQFDGDQEYLKSFFPVTDERFEELDNNSVEL